MKKSVENEGVCCLPAIKLNQLKKSASKRNLFETEELLSHVIKRPSIRGGIFIAGVLFVSTLAGVQNGFNSLAGHIPYTSWKCNGNYSTKCLMLTEGVSDSDDRSVHNKSTLCQNDLKQGLHFLWDFDPRKHFSTQWGLVCQHSTKAEMVATSFFIGGAVGALVSGFLNDVLGRRSSALIGFVISIHSTFMSAVSPNSYFLSIFRFFQGLGTIMYFPAVYIYIMELSPPKFRVAISTLYMSNWTVGNLLAVLTFYSFQTWSSLLTVTGCLLVLGVFPLLVGPDSPRFQLVTLRREEEARKGLEWLFEIGGYSYDFDALKCALTFKEQRLAEIKGLTIFKLHPKFARQLLVLLFLWFTMGFSYYGFSAGQSSSSKNITLSVFYAVIDEIGACIVTVAPLLYLGRRLTIFMFFIASGVSVVIMMIPMPSLLGTLIAHIGYIAVSATFNCLYLFTFELAPTTHRGRIVNAGIFMSRIGSVLGTEASLLHETNRYLSQCIFAILLFLAAGATLQTPETIGQPTPNVPAEVEKRDETVVKRLSSEDDKETHDLQLSTL